MEHIITAAALLDAQSALSANWDLKSFLQNSRSYIQMAGGLLLMLMGVAALIWGGVTLLMKLMSNEQSSHKYNWGKIIMLILIGGALGTGGWALISKVGSGGQKTIEDLGGGTVIVGSAIPGIDSTEGETASVADLTT